MSVILGVQTIDKIIIATDNKITNENGCVKNDAEKKMILFNEHLCVATAGNRLGYLILESIYKQNEMHNFYMEDFAKKITELYNKNKDNIFFKLPISYIMAGMTKESNYGMIAIDARDGKLKPVPCVKILYPPDGLRSEVTNKILDKNIKKYPEDFYIHTIHKISKKNRFVSHSGDVWIYNTKSGEGEIRHFK